MFELSVSAPTIWHLLPLAEILSNYGIGRVPYEKYTFLINNIYILEIC